jgi:hypothetical protein
LIVYTLDKKLSHDFVKDKNSCFCQSQFHDQFQDTKNIVQFSLQFFSKSNAFIDGTNTILHEINNQMKSKLLKKMKIERKNLCTSHGL